MPSLLPFRGLRYASGPDVSALVAPPYDVIDGTDQANLEGRSEHNAVRVEVPRDEGSMDRYTNARCLLEEWIGAGVLVRDREPTLTVYRMTYRDEDGATRRTLGVLGALTMQEGGLLPHEHTTPKAKDDRFNLLRACRTNVSPIWVLAPTPGLSGLLPTDEPPAAVATDDDGVVHETWVIHEPAALDGINQHLSASPVIVADGHHRYEVARAYRDEQRASNGHQPGGYDAVLAYVVELDDEQLTVGPIHRLVNGLPADLDIAEALAPFFDATPVDEPHALALITADGAWSLTPRDASAHELDSSRIAEALAALPPHDVTYQHGRSTIRRAVADGRAQAGFLLRPATVEQIAETGRSGVRMPPKTTFFYPKPRTGLVFRPLD